MAGQYNIRFAQGSDLKRNFTVRAGGDLWVFTGRSLRMQVRQQPGDPLVFEADNDNGRLVAGDPPTTLVLSASGAATGLIPVGSYAYDIWVDSYQLLAGLFTVDPRVTT